MTILSRPLIEEEHLPTPLFYWPKTCQSSRGDFFLAKVYSISWVPDSFLKELCLDSLPNYIDVCITLLATVACRSRCADSNELADHSDLECQSAQTSHLLILAPAFLCICYEYTYIPYELYSVYIYILYSDVECQPALETLLPSETDISLFKCFVHSTPLPFKRC